MSATIEADQYINYFTISEKVPEYLQIEGQLFYVEEKYLEDVESEVEEQSWGDFRPATTDVVFEYRNVLYDIMDHNLWYINHIKC